MGDNPKFRGRERFRKTIGQTIMKDLYLNGLPLNIIYDRILCRCLIHVSDPPNGKRHLL